MPNTILLLIGLFVFGVVSVAILFVAYQDAVDRKRDGKDIDSPIDEAMIKAMGSDT